MIELQGDVVKQLCENKMKYDSLHQAILMAKEAGLSDYITNEMSEQRKEVKEQYNKSTYLILDMMKDKRSTILGDNIVKIDDWLYGVLYLGGNGKHSLRFLMLKDTELGILQKSYKDRDWTSMELEALAPALLDDNNIALYNLAVENRARTILSSYCDVNALPCSDTIRTDVCVSDHATKRWVQRKIGIKDENQLEEYKVEHLPQLHKDILEAFKSSSEIWEDEEGYKYYFDNDNMVYIVRGNVIITIYEEDFGFSKSINRMIVIQQAQVLLEAHNQWKNIEKKYCNEVKEISSDLHSCEDEIETAELLISNLKYKKEEILARKEKSKEDLKASREVYEAEFVKLFRIKGVQYK